MSAQSVAPAVGRLTNVKIEAQPAYTRSRRG
jgi:hypothetical protein